MSTPTAIILALVLIFMLLTVWATSRTNAALAFISYHEANAVHYDCPTARC